MNTVELRKLLADGRLIIGRNAVVRALRASSVSQVLVASNAPVSDVEGVRGYAALVNVPVDALESTNDQLGTMCRKPFPIAFVAVRRS